MEEEGATEEEEKEEEGAGSQRSKTKTPHKDVGKNRSSFRPSFPGFLTMKVPHFERHFLIPNSFASICTEHVSAIIAAEVSMAYQFKAHSPPVTSREGLQQHQPNFHSVSCIPS